MPYASQRYGRRHPLRRVLTSRKLATRARAEARRTRQYAKAKREWEAQCQVAAKEVAERVREQEEHRETERAREARHRQARAEMRAVVEAYSEENRMYLDAIEAGDLSPRSLQGQAALLLSWAAKAFDVRL